MATMTKTALITGTSRGIGPYIARAMANAGYNVVLTSRSAREVEDLATELRTGGFSAVAVPADITDSGDLEHMVRVAQSEFSPIDVLVNNAGGDPQREFDQMSWVENERIIRLNLLAPMELTHRVLPAMLERGSGHIVNISSLAGRIGFPYAEAYAAAKDGIIGFTRVLRNDYRGRGVSASAIVLGAIRDAGQGQRTSEELGFEMPRYSTAPAQAVAVAVVKAIAHDKAEIVVMPGPGRLMKALLDLFPGLGPTMNSMAGANATMQRVIEFRKRSTLGAGAPR